jgi:hypothetical protein
MNVARRPSPHLPVLLIALSLASGSARPVAASIRAEALAPRPTSPAADAVVPETGVRFAWVAPAGTSRHLLVIGREPFDTRGWTRLPADDALVVRTLDRPVASLADLGLTLEADTRLWWAAASVDGDGRRTTFSPVQTFYALRRFANRVEPSPLLQVSPIGAAVADAAPRADRIRLAAGYEIDPALGEPAIPAGLRESAEAVGGRRSFLVYYGDSDPDATREAILAAGGLVVAYVPDRTFLVRMDAGSAFGVDGGWIGAYQPAYKLSPRLPAEAPAAVEFDVLVFPDGDLAAVTAAARAAGGEVQLTSDNGINRKARIRAAAAAAQALAQHPDVAWIEPWVQPELHNTSAQWEVQTAANLNRRVWDLGIRGLGQVVMTSDSGVEMGHNMFRDATQPVTTFGDYPTHRKVIAYRKSWDNELIQFADHGSSLHGTHTACTVAGNDSGLATNSNDGIAKDAKLFFMDISGAALGNSVLPPPDLNDLFQPSYDGNAGGAARISSNSWGAAVSGAYTLNSLEVDQFTWNHPDYLILFSNGNSAGNGTVGSPASAKNTVGVGGTGNGGATQINTIYSFTSRGPTQDGRRKPTICAPADPVRSAAVAPNTTQLLSGTSMASPAAAGCVALIRQYLTNGWYPTGSPVPGNGFTPSAALLKAMAVNSGNNMITGFNTPSFDVGWGRINADSVLYFAGDARRLLLVDHTSGLGHGQSIEYQVNVVDGSIPLKVSLCWTDYPGNPASGTQLVNNLNLTVSHGATTYLGNVFAGGLSATGGGSDQLNVEEGVRVASPATGVWTVRIDAPNVPFGPQPFGLVITGGVGTTAGALAIDRASYGTGGTVQVRVTDTDAGASASVTLSSTTEPGGETVTVTGPNGVLDGSIALSPAAGTLGDGVLQVAHGDTIYATYVDASPSATLTTRAVVDLVAPAITNVRADGQGGGSVLVQWNTDVPADSRVHYGPTPALGANAAVSELVTSHAVTIEGLAFGETYYFDVESADLGDNTTRDDRDGAHHRFTVGLAGDILLVYDGEGFARHNRYVSSLEAAGWTFDVWTGAKSRDPVLGDAASGMRSYKAVWWQNDLDNYPAFLAGARDAITQYLDGGGRMAVVGHDIAWTNMDNASGDPSPYYSAARAAWMQSTLHTQFVADPPTWPVVTGVAGDPISDPFTGGAPYIEHRAGASGDEVAMVPGTGFGSSHWLSGDATPDSCGFRWESGGPVGTPGTALWAGTPSRLATMYFEWSSIDGGAETSTVRDEVLARTLSWLIGRGKPVAAVTAPNGSELITADSVWVAWTETPAPATSIATRVLEYSLDGGQSWAVISSSPGTSPYLWQLAGVPNSSQVLVRVRLHDDGTPALSGFDASDAVFTIARAGGDTQGPRVVAGSIHTDPTPLSNTQPAYLTATVTDAGTGGSAVVAAEWSFGDIAAPAGAGEPMWGAFGSAEVALDDTIDTSTFPPGTRTLWVRGRDAEGNWGPAHGQPVLVNGSGVLASGPRGVTRYELAQNAPNPVTGATTIAFALPERGDVDLAIYDVGGRRVRMLSSGPLPSGLHQVGWDRRDAAGRLVQPGVYYYRLAVAGRRFERRLVTLN